MNDKSERYWQDHCQTMPKFISFQLPTMIKLVSFEAPMMGLSIGRENKFSISDPTSTLKMAVATVHFMKLEKYN